MGLCTGEGSLYPPLACSWRRRIFSFLSGAAPLEKKRKEEGGRREGECEREVEENNLIGRRE